MRSFVIGLLGGLGGSLLAEVYWKINNTKFELAILGAVLCLGMSIILYQEKDNAWE